MFKANRGNLGNSGNRGNRETKDHSAGAMNIEHLTKSRLEQHVC